MLTSSPTAALDGEQPEVFVEASGLGVVVAGADVRVAAQDAVLVLAHDHAELAVRLEPDDAVHDVAAGLLELARPPDVGLLVEAGLDLDEHQHLLAGLGSVDQCVHDRRVTAGAVERLLDGQDVRVVGGLLEEGLDAGARTSRTGGAAGRRGCA